MIIVLWKRPRLMMLALSDVCGRLSYIAFHVMMAPSGVIFYSRKNPVI